LDLVGVMGSFCSWIFNENNKGIIMNQEMTDRLKELLLLAVVDLNEVDDPFAEDAKGSLIEALALIDGDFGSFDELDMDGRC
jgi:hypothetical protein